jgi:nitroreductase
MNIKEQILNALDFRFACKEFDINKKILEDDFNVILESARLSPSSYGLEPWKLIILDNKNIRQKIKPFCWGAQKQLDTADRYLILLARSSKDMEYNSDYIKETMGNLHKSPPDVVITRQERLEKFQETNFNSLNNIDILFQWACRQTYIILANMMMSASLLKIDSCPIEGFDMGEVEKILIEENILDKEHFGVACMVAFGYRTSGPDKQRSRREISEVVKLIP